MTEYAEKSKVPMIVSEYPIPSSRGKSLFCPYVFLLLHKSKTINKIDRLFGTKRKIQEYPKN